ncbi:MAG TPA: response regulator transcription factor [Verrucomicrobiae bacterium]|nr:response regulator transcription factor [Verrucomicrobiae bacterium]
MTATTDNVTDFQTNSALTPLPATRPIRVWLTDDNAGFRELLEELLERSGGFNCELQFNSAEALLDGLTTEPAPDVILLDVEMGGMTGVDALRPVRALAPEVRVLIITSFWDPLYEVQALRNGASAYLIKANAPLSLVSEIHRALTSPVTLAPLPCAEIEPETPATSQPLRPEPRKSFAARFRSWAAHVSANLLRPAPVSSVEGHP